MKRHNDIGLSGNPRFTVRSPSDRTFGLEQTKDRGKKKLHGAKKSDGAKALGNLIKKFRQKKSEGMDKIRYGKHIAPILVLFRQIGNDACLNRNISEKKGHESIIEAFRKESLVMVEWLEREIVSHVLAVRTLSVEKSNKPQVIAARDTLHKRYKQLMGLSADMAEAGVDPENMPNMVAAQMRIDALNSSHRETPSAYNVGRMATSRPKKLYQRRMARSQVRQD